MSDHNSHLTLVRTDNLISPQQAPPSGLVLMVAGRLTVVSEVMYYLFASSIPRSLTMLKCVHFSNRQIRS